MATKRINKSAKVSTRKVTPAEPKPLAIAPARVWSLNSFVDDANPKYLEFLSYLRAGVTVGAAAACVRLPPSTAALWFGKYREPTEGRKDAKLLKLGQDIEQAIGEASVVAEAEQRQGDVEKWLSGPSRRMLNNDFAPENNAVPSSLSLQPSNPSVTNNLIIAGDYLKDALGHLEQAGVITQRRTTEVISTSTPATKK